MRKATLFTLKESIMRILLMLLFAVTASLSIKAQDCPPLTVFCQDLHTSFMADACMVEVWAKDFISKINDAQTSLDSFDISFEEDSIVMSRIFESMFGSTYDTISIWITSQCDPNLKTRCIVSLDINDNTGNCPGTPCPVDPNPWCGYAVITCSTVQGTPTETTGHVAAIIDTRKNSEAPRGDNWTSPVQNGIDSVDILRPDAWTINNIGNIFGIAVNPTNGDIFLGASDIYEFDFIETLTLGPPPPSITGPAGSAGIYRSSFDLPETISAFVSTRATYPAAAVFDIAIIGSNLIPNTGNIADDDTRSGNGIGNIDHDLRSNHLFATNLEDGKIYSINATTGLIKDVFDPFDAYVHSAGLAPASERVWGLQVHDCGLSSRLYFSRNARVPTLQMDIVQPKEIWSVALNVDGTFQGVERIEVVVGRGDMAKLTDLAFSADCNEMLVSERGSPHSSEIHSYIRAADDSWAYNRQFFVGLNDPTIQTFGNGVLGNSSAGGVTFGPTEENCTIDANCDGLVWATHNCGDIAADDANPTNPFGCAIYGLEGINSTGNARETNSSTDIYIAIDRDLSNPVLLKSNIGDVEIFNCCCPFDEGRHTIATAQSAMIAGEIYTEEKYRVEDARVSINSSSNNSEVMTNQYGEYQFADLDMYVDYNVQPQKSSDIRDGISTLDLIYIQKHILNFKNLNSPYKLIAADINGDSKVSAQDLVLLRRILLGLEDGRDIPSWTFVPQSFQFADESNPFPFANAITLNQLEKHSMHEDFVAIKRGDVNGDNHVNLLAINRNIDQTGLNIDIIDQVAYVSLSESMSLSGLQFELSFGDQLASDIINDGAISLQAGNVNVTDNSIKVSWAGSTDIRVSKGEVLFSFSMSDGDANQLTFSSVSLAPEVYYQGGLLKGLSLSTKLISASSKLHGSVPNPFIDEATILFDLPKKQKVTFDFYTTSGQRINSVSKTFDQGSNTLTVDDAFLDVNKNNIVIYRMETEDYISFGKMIKL